MKIFSYLLIAGLLLSCVSCVTERFELRGKEAVPLQRTRQPLIFEQKVDDPAQEADTADKEKKTQPPADSEELFIKRFLKDCRKEKDGKLTKFYRVQYQDVNKLIALLNNWKSKQTRLIAHPETNRIIITDTEEGLKDIARVLRRLDCSTPQVQIRVRVVEISASSSLEYGLEYTQDRTDRSSLLKNIGAKLNPKNYNDSLKPGATPFQGATFTLFTSGKQAGQVDILIRALHEAGNAEILSCPDLLVSKDATASLHTGQQIPYQKVNVIGTQTQYFTEFKNVGVELNVRPLFVGEDAVKLYVKPNVSSLTGWTDPALVGGISNPIISTRHCETTVEVQNGQTLVIAGLLENRKLLIKRSVPIIGNIPLLGYLFSSTRHEIDKTQLLFFLTINVVHPGRPENAPRIFRPENSGKK
jgi:type II secretory pathway component GspD/PulD (secretin)